MSINKLIESKQFFNVILENLQSMVFVVNKDMEILDYNSALKNHVQKDDKDILNKRCGNVLGCMYAVEQNQLCGLTTECDKCVLNKAIIETSLGRAPIDRQMLSRFFYFKGKKRQNHYIYSTRYIEFENKKLILIVLDDVTELEEKRLILEKIAVMDELTNIYNRRYLIDILNKQIAGVKRFNWSFSVIMFDVDKFKYINDNYGHLSGDKTLEIISKEVGKILRTIDFFGRYGGDEFFIILPNIDKAGAISCADRIQKLVSGLKIDGVKNQVTISGGVAEYKIGMDIREIIKEVDDALYRAKENGKNRIES